MNTAVWTGFYWIETVSSAVGAGVAGTLWWAHRQNIDLPCTSGGGCGEVNASHWSHLTLGPLHHIPVALLGLITYLVLMTLAMAKTGSDKESYRSLIHIPFCFLSLVGFCFSWYLQYVAHFEIGAFCVWCFTSALVMTFLLITATWEGLTRLQSRRQQVMETRPSAHV